MAESIRHRGPDEDGFRIEPEIALGFVRLSIVDLAGGSQPMSNEDNSIWVVFNGELYNHCELRKQLEDKGHRFKTDHADTEVLVHGWEEWGEKLVDYLNGMFAFAIWDSRKKALFLARDRYGIKPLYYAVTQQGDLLFASEIRAIHASGLVEKKEDHDGIMEYLSQQNTWGERTMFASVKEFPAATWEFVPQFGQCRRERYWDYCFPRSSKLSLGEAAEAHREILGRVVRRQIAADVDVVGYLSGGIDSSALVSAAYRMDPKVKAYSCLFNLDNVGDDRTSDEREYSRAVARYLDIQHIEMELAQDALKYNLDDTVRSLETLRMGMSYENYLIAQRVAKDSKVVLSGTGGDELHGGYLYRYQAVNRVTNEGIRQYWLKRIKILLGMDGGFTDGQLIYRGMLNFPVAEGIRSEVLAPDFVDKASNYNFAKSFKDMLKQCPHEDIRDQLMYIDARTYLHGLLVLEDKLSMAHSLEARVPLLDNELVDFVSDLPWSLLCDNQTGKIIFRESVRPWVPDAIYRKPKMGFGPPDASWYRGALRPFIESELSDERVRRRGIFKPAFVRQILDNHFNGQANNASTIWTMLCLESWCRNTGLLGG